MKKIFLILLVAVNLLPLTSCSKDDDNDSGNGSTNNYSTLIIGKWLWDCHIWCGEEFRGNFSEMETVEFRSNKTCIVNGRGDFPYTVTGNELAIKRTDAGITIYYKIESITKTEFVIEYPQSYVYDCEEGMYERYKPY